MAIKYKDNLSSFETRSIDKGLERAINCITTELFPNKLDLTSAEVIKEFKSIIDRGK